MFSFPLLGRTSKNPLKVAARNRRLGYVTLEERMLLTTIDPAFNFVDVPEPGELPTEPAPELSPLDPPLTGEGEEDPGLIEFGETDDGGIIINPGPNQAPVLYGFGWYFDENVYYFSGYVSDDQDPTGLYVSFGGIIDGAYTEVMSGGYFNFSIELVEPAGYVTATFTDIEFLSSNTETVYL